MRLRIRPHACYPLLLLCFLLCSACGGGVSGGASASRTEESFTETFVSPDTNTHQGYATDGSSHYLIHDDKLYKRSNDATWTLERSNESVFSDLAGFNHLGGGEYLNGKLYIVGEQLTDCNHVSSQSIFAFDAVTLVRESVHNISAHIYEASALTFVTDSDEIWVASYCDGTGVAIFDAATMSYKRTLTLTPPLPQIQGIAYHDGHIYLAHTSGLLYELARDGTTKHLFSTGLAGEHEGIDFTTGELRWLIDGGPGNRKVHFYKPGQ